MKASVSLKHFVSYCRTKEMAYIINLDEHKSIVIHWIALYVNNDNEGFQIDQIKNFIGNKKIAANV